MARESVKQSPSTGRRPPLTADRIVDAALALIDEEGLSRLTMRRLATRLESAPMSLYEYFDSKASLERAIADRVLSAAFPPPAVRAQGTPCDRMLWTAQHVRGVVSRYPDLVPLLIRHPRAQQGRGVDSLFDIHLFRDAAREDGWTDEHLPLLMAAIVKFILGSLAYESARSSQAPDEDDPESLRATVGRLEDRLGPTALEARVLATFLPENTDAVFEASFVALYEGLRSRFCNSPA